MIVALAPVPDPSELATPEPEITAASTTPSWIATAPVNVLAVASMRNVPVPVFVRPPVPEITPLVRPPAVAVIPPLRSSDSVARSSVPPVNRRKPVPEPSADVLVIVSTPPRTSVPSV